MIDALAELVRDVGQSLLSWRTSGGTSGTWEGTQFHAAADLWAHQRLSAGLASIQPAVPIVSEEDQGSERQGSGGRYWLIDPIDGTASYAGGYSGFVTQVALMEDEQPVMAAVFAPDFQDLFLAERGGGAFLNGVRLTAVPASSLTLVDNYPRPRGVADEVYRAFSFQRYLECGSIGLKICRVADATADVFVKAVRTRDWDLAAPQLVLHETGGSLLDGEGNAMVYGGTRSRQGLVAARDAGLARRIASSALLCAREGDGSR